MGLFSGKKKTYVSSVAYNLNGDLEEQRDVFKDGTLQAILEGNSVGQTMVNNVLNGGGLKMRTAFNYARDYYEYGVPKSNTVFMDSPDVAVVIPILQSMNQNQEILMDTLVIGTADYVWWAEQYLTSRYNWNRATELFLSAPNGVDADALVTFDLEADRQIHIYMVNNDNSVHVESFYPDSMQPSSTYVHCAYQTRSTFQGAGSTTTRPYEPGDVDGTTPVVTTVQRNGETQVTTTTTVVDTDGSNTTITVTKVTQVTSNFKYFIYLLGTGTYPTLDALKDSTTLSGGYYPSVPMRLNGQDMLDESKMDTDLYKTSKILLKKLNLKIEDIREKINDNNNIDDIDFAFLVFGVALNTPKPAGKKYLYRFFKKLQTLQAFSKTEWNAWTGTSSPQTNVLEVFNEKQRQNNYDIKIQWQYVETTIHTGLAGAGANVGDVFISVDADPTITTIGTDQEVESTKLYARKQLDADTYEQLEVCGLYYDNYVYNGKSVGMSAWDMFKNPDEEGFIVPLDRSLLSNVSLKEITELSYETSFIVFNCYTIVKQKWYQTGIFRIIIFVIGVILCILFPPAGVGILLAVVGIEVAVATFIQLLIAAIVYMILAMLVARIFSAVASTFGGKWGQLIAAVVVIVVAYFTGDYSTAVNSAGTVAVNVIQATAAVYQGYMAAEMYDINKDLKDLSQQYSDQMAHLEQLWKELLPTYDGWLDIASFTQAAERILESPDTFLTRTLMTGPQIAEFTMGAVTNFADIGLQLPIYT